MPRKKSFINVQDQKHNVKQNPPVNPVITNNSIAVSEQQDQEKMSRYWQGTLQCLAHSSFKRSNEYHNQQKGCIYNTWEVVGEKENQMKI